MSDLLMRDRVLRLLATAAATFKALAAERDGKTFYFYSDHCRQKFLSTPAGAKPKGKSGGCCG